jgi:hypothetical protein
MLSPMKPL